ncbi:MAG: CaiB/BaiF CoA-transferase family protein [Cytophagales bacterium]|nr:CaiB/BaiF CoA-transferase family protein [Cytophagales bacterium]
MSWHNHPLPLAGIRVIEFTHMVMGPTCGMLLADLGADVIKVEPIKGDNTRRLLGSGAGFFPLYNRNKRSFAVDLKTPEGLEAVLKLIATADVVSHNFKSETMQAQGLDYETLCKMRDPALPALIYVDHRGFLPGPYDHRTALDEVVQMMGGLAYMTGRRGDPLRAGSSVNDMMGGIFGAVACMAALMQRQKTGRGQQVQSALFENNILLVAQHMMQFQVTGQAAAPMPERISAWGVYDVFTVQGGEQIFLSAVSDTQWKIFCEALQFADLFNDPQLKTNNDRVTAREWFIPLLRDRLKDFSAQYLSDLFEAKGLPFAPIKAPHELLDDPHIKASGGMAKIELTDGARAGEAVDTILFPFKMDGSHLGVRRSPPKLGEHTKELLREVGYSNAQIENLQIQGKIR